MNINWNGLYFPNIQKEPIYNNGFCLQRLLHKSNICCTCKKTGCLKRYCSCYLNQIYCNGCECKGCKNIPPPEYLKNNNIKVEKGTVIPHQNISNKNNIFGHNTLFQNDSTYSMECKSCKCSQSHCTRKYCECYKINKRCTNACRCLGCENREPYSSTNEDDKNKLINQNISYNNNDYNSSLDNYNNFNSNKNSNEIKSKKEYYNNHKLLCPFEAEGISVEFDGSEINVNQRKILLGNQKNTNKNTKDNKKKNTNSLLKNKRNLDNKSDDIVDNKKKNKTNNQNKNKNSCRVSDLQNTPKMYPQKYSNKNYINASTTTKTASPHVYTSVKKNRKKRDRLLINVPKKLNFSQEK